MATLPSTSHALAGRASWPVAAGASAAALVGLLLAYRDTAGSLLRLWWESGVYGHGLLVLAISLYLVWRRRSVLARCVPAANPWGLALLALAVGGWLVAALVDVRVGQQLALVLLIATLVWSVLGTRIARELAFPLAYLLLAVPVWEVLVPYLQDYTATYSTRLTQALGVPVFLENRYMSIPSGQFLIAEVCAGLRYLLATLSVATLFAYLTYRSLWRSAVFVAAGVVLSIVFNWLRVVAVVVIGHASAMQHPLVEDHLLVGWVMFAIALVPLYAFGLWLRERDAPAPGGQVGTARPAKRSGRLALVAVAALGLGVAASGPAMARIVKQPGVSAPIVDPGPVPAMGGWAGPFEPRDGWRPRFQGADWRTLQRYERAGREVSLFVALYRHQAQGAELVNEANALYDASRWRARDEGSRAVPLPGGRRLEARQVRLRSARGASRLLWYGYYVGGRFTASPYEAKLLQLRGLLTGRREAVLMALATDAGVEDAEALLADFARAFAPVVAAHVRGGDADPIGTPAGG